MSNHHQQSLIGKMLADGDLQHYIASAISMDENISPEVAKLIIAACQYSYHQGNRKGGTFWDSLSNIHKFIDQINRKQRKIVLRLEGQVCGGSLTVCDARTVNLNPEWQLFPSYPRILQVINLGFINKCEHLDTLHLDYQDTF